MLSSRSNTISAIVFSLTAVLMGGVFFATFFYSNNIQDISGQICCQNIVSNNTNLTISYATGKIVSLQDHENGQPTWIANGDWNMSRTKSLGNNQTNPGELTFYAKFDMFNILRGGKEKFRIESFKLTNSSIQDTSAIINGTAIIITPDGAIVDVPVNIKITDPSSKDQVITTWLDPKKVNNYFGSTPVLYGTVKKLQ